MNHKHFDIGCRGVVHKRGRNLHVYSFSKIRCVVIEIKY